MLKQLFPKLYQRYLSSPLLGPILDGYEDWLSDRKYTRKTRRVYMRMSLLVDRYLRELGLENLADISADHMQDLWSRYHINGPNARSLGGTIRTMAACLDDKGLLRPASPKPPTPFEPYLKGYATYLRDIRGFVSSTIHYHLFTIQQESFVRIKFHRSDSMKRLYMIDLTVSVHQKTINRVLLWSIR